MRKKQLEYENPREIIRYVHDHEILFAFKDDDGAVAFDEWWHSEGEKTFVKWAKDWTD